MNSVNRSTARIRLFDYFPHGRSSKEIVWSDQIIRMPLIQHVSEFIEQSCRSRVHHVFRLLWQKCSAAGAILLDDVLFDEPHVSYDSCMKAMEQQLKSLKRTTLWPAEARRRVNAKNLRDSLRAPLSSCAAQTSFAEHRPTLSDVGCFCLPHYHFSHPRSVISFSL